MQPPFLVHQETSDLFRNPHYNKVRDRLHSAYRAWESCAPLQSSLAEPTLKCLTDETLPVALEFINARRTFQRLVRANPPEDKNPWLLKYSKCRRLVY